MKILSDKELSKRADLGQLIALMDGVFRDKAAGKLVAPPRVSVPIGDQGSLVFTVGGAQERNRAGFRVYDTFAGDSEERSEITAVFDSASGAMLGIVLGSALGAYRTGAIGGLAIQHLALSGRLSLGIVGTGRQAATQILAAHAVRELTDVRVYSRSEERRTAFAKDIERRIGQPVRPVETAEAACADSQLVICATTSPRPVIEADWLSEGCHVQSVGPKYRGRHEIGLDVVGRAARVVTDAPEQIRGYSGETFFLEGTPHMDRIEDLATIVARCLGVRRREETTLFISAGLAGTEVLVADFLLAQA